MKDRIDKDIFEVFQETVAERTHLVAPSTSRGQYPHADYDYSTDDYNDYEYQQNRQ